MTRNERQAINGALLLVFGIFNLLIGLNNGYSWFSGVLEVWGGLVGILGLVLLGLGIFRYDE